MAHLTIEGLDEERVSLEREALQQGGGALVGFTGIVRPDRYPDGRRVTALWYEAYAAMAELQLQHLIAQARAQWSLGTVQIRHRLGLVPAGRMSVVILVAAPHRREAFAASQFLLEGLKRDIPIWKREHYDDGTTAWVNCAH